MPAFISYMPAVQLEHALAPTAEYSPAAQFTHTDDSVPPVPGAYVPALQLVQATAPATAAKAPGPHGPQSG